MTAAKSYYFPEKIEGDKMELFEKVNLSNSLKNEVTLRFDEALAAIALIVFLTDGYLANVEVSLLSILLSRMQLFSNYPSQVIARMFDNLIAILNNEGNQILLKVAMKGVPCYLYNYDFAFTTDLVLADFEVTEQKEQFLVSLCSYLEIPEETVSEIFRVMLKN